MIALRMIGKGTTISSVETSTTSAAPGAMMPPGGEAKKEIPLYLHPGSDEFLINTILPNTRLRHPGADPPAREPRWPKGSLVQGEYRQGLRGAGSMEAG